MTLDLKLRAMQTISFIIEGTPNQKRSTQPNAFMAGKRADGSEIWRGKSRPHPKNGVVAANIQELVYKAGWPEKSDCFAGAVLLSVKGYWKIPSGVPAWKLPLYETEQIVRTSMPDLDRVINMVQDALKGVVWKDDSQVVGYPHSGKFYGRRERTEVTICLMRPQIPASQDEFKKMMEV